MYCLKPKKCKLVAWFAALVVITVFVSAPAFAEQEPESKHEASKVKRVSSMREPIYKRLQVAQKLADNEDYQGALDKLKALDSVQRNDYEKAMTDNMLAFIYFNTENYVKAAKAYENITQLESIPEGVIQTAWYSLAKLYLMQEQYGKALTALNAWFKRVEKPGGEAYILRAQIYYQQEQFSKALPDIKKAMVYARAKNKQPDENWLLLERAVYYQNKNYQGMAKSLQDLLLYYPKPSYWFQLAGVYGELDLAKKQLATLEAAFEQNLFSKQQEYITLAQLFLMQEVPYKAAKVLLTGMQKEQVEQSAKNLSLLGDALMLAKEYEQALDVMQRAAKASNKGRDYYKLAQIYAERQDYPSALKHIDNALELGDLKSLQSAYTLRGLILLNLNQLSEAKKQFLQLQNESKDAEKDKAKQWLDYIESEQRRLDYMQSQ